MNIDEIYEKLTHSNWGDISPHLKDGAVCLKYLA